MAAVNSGLFVSGSKELKLWSTTTGECLYTFGRRSNRPPYDPYYHVLAMRKPTMTYLVSSTKSDIEIWSIKGGGSCNQSPVELVRTISVSDQGKVDDLQEVALGKTFVSQHSNKFQIWDVETGERLQSLSLDPTSQKFLPKDSVARISDDMLLIARNYKMRVWTVSTGNTRAFERKVWKVFGLRNGCFASTSTFSDGCLRCWNPEGVCTFRAGPRNEKSIGMMNAKPQWWQGKWTPTTVVELEDGIIACGDVGGQITIWKVKDQRLSA